MRNDGNNVDIDREMAALAKNTIMFEALSQEIKGEFEKIKTAIIEGGR
jgi:flagellar basal-body rod protein FlgB